MVATMTVVREFYANIVENTLTHVVFVRGKHVRYDATTINQLFRLQYTPVGPNKLDVLFNRRIWRRLVMKSVEGVLGGTL